MTFAVVTGGGTSGHVLPARAVIEALEDAGIDIGDIAYVGARRGVEREMMSDFAARGVDCAFLPMSGLQRSFAPSALLANASLLWRIPRSRMLATRLIGRWRPRVVVSVGGYASEPMSSAAVAKGVPLVCVSYDRTPGLATRRQAKHAAVCAVAFSDSPLPRAVHTGAPVRREIRALNADAARERARRDRGIPADAVVLTVTGGSLGSVSLNRVVPVLAERLAAVQPGRFAIYHVCGPRYAQTPDPPMPASVWYRRVGYEQDIASLYAATDVLLCRAGASTVAEIATVGLASIVVPWPESAEDHQSLNARWLGEAGASLVVADDALEDAASLDSMVRVLTHEESREVMARAARQLGLIHRGGSLASVIIDAAQ